MMAFEAVKKHLQKWLDTKIENLSDQATRKLDNALADIEKNLDATVRRLVREELEYQGYKTK